MSKVWFITGTGHGMGVDIAKAALAARYVNPMVAPEARAATIKLVPRSTSS
jgi:hypothetical protein